jgi:hypothetical protein
MLLAAVWCTFLGSGEIGSMQSDFFFRSTLSLYVPLYIVLGGQPDASRCSLVHIFGIWGARINAIRFFFRSTLSLYVPLYIVLGGHFDASRCSLVQIFG